MPTPRGLRNNNPLNIRHNRDRFLGEVVPGTDRNFKQFGSMACGYRAAFVVLYTYLKRGIDTVEKIIRAWAPPTENNTESYIATVVQRSGVGRNKVLTADSGGDYIRIVAAMSHCENGVPAVMADVEAGFRLQNKLKVKS
jgi:hypothetical protein